MQVTGQHMGHDLSLVKYLDARGFFIVALMS